MAFGVGWCSVLPALRFAVALSPPVTDAVFVLQAVAIASLALPRRVLNLGLVHRCVDKLALITEFLALSCRHWVQSVLLSLAIMGCTALLGLPRWILTAGPIVGVAVVRFRYSQRPRVSSCTLWLCACLTTIRYRISSLRLPQYVASWPLLSIVRPLICISTGHPRLWQAPTCHTLAACSKSWLFCP